MNKGLSSLNRGKLVAKEGERQGPRQLEKFFAPRQFKFTMYHNMVFVIDIMLGFMYRLLSSITLTLLYYVNPATLVSIRCLDLERLYT